MSTPFVIHDDMTVGELIEQLKQLDKRQRFRVQAILPDKTPWNAPAKVGEIHGSNCGNGLPYVFLSVRCDGSESAFETTQVIGKIVRGPNN